MNPELCFKTDSAQAAVKLYFKADPRPTKDRLGAIIVLMQETFPKDRVAVLDVRTGKLYDDKAARASMDVYLRAQAQAFMHMWNGI